MYMATMLYMVSSAPGHIIYNRQKVLLIHQEQCISTQHDSYVKDLLSKANQLPVSH